MDDVTLAAQTMFAELTQRALDAEFDETYREAGAFKKRTRSGRDYWYYVWDAGGSKHEKYVGPAADEAITERVGRFAGIKSDYKQRREMVRALQAVGLPQPDGIAGTIVEAMWKAGFFRLRGALVGSLAYQCYGGLLGVRLGAASLRTDDVDFAQFWGISENIGESMPAPLTVLKTVDPTFKDIPDVNDPFVTSRYRNKGGYKVEFLTPNRGSDAHQSKPAKMKAMSGAGAQPLRHLDYLIHHPARSTLLFGGGIPVTIPRPERYAVHKLIVAVERQDQVKSRKDLTQAGELIRALSRYHARDLADAWNDANAIGPSWRDKLRRGADALPAGAAETLRLSIQAAANAEGKTDARRTSKS